MPNDCWNHITITCEYPEQLTMLIQNELQQKQSHDFPGVSQLLAPYLINLNNPRIPKIHMLIKLPIIFIIL